MFSHFRVQKPGLPGTLLTAALLVVVLAFSLIVFAVAAAAGAVAWGYLWWKTRAARKQMREMRERAAAGQTAGGGQIIEGDAVRVESPAIPANDRRP